MLKENITKDEISKRGKELLGKFETTDMTVEEVNNELVKFAKKNKNKEKF